MTFNSHLYIGALFLILLLILLDYFIFENKILLFLSILLIINVITSSIVSYFVYDKSNFYELRWLRLKSNSHVLNINAGFDEISQILRKKFPNINLSIADFYNPTKHTEKSIKKARKRFPPNADCKKINTTKIDFPDNTFDNILLVMSAHEIRNSKERDIFFKELHRIVKPRGEIHVVEHLRNIPNSLAYSFGVFHFHTKKEWIKNFNFSGLKVVKMSNHTPFITIFKINSHGTSF